MNIIDKFIEKFKKEHIIFKILYVMLIMALIYDILHLREASNYFLCVMFLVIVLKMVEWFFSKE